ncbi:MAG: N-acetylmuramoyl-L-alanine amidase, partial [Vulcanimicrobiota bacterium]
VAPVQDLKQERVTDLRLNEEENRVVFKLLTTGPVQYEWRRLLPPDNRYFVDIPNCVYTAKEFSKNFNVGYIKSVNVKQYRDLPDPVVRVSFELHVPCQVKVFPDPDRPLEIRMEVYDKTINPRFAERQGFGITDFPAPGGVVICIDPGHGGGDPGACNSSMGLQEKKLTLDIALRLAKLLKKAGWNVVMTRTTDRDVSFAGSSDARELGDRVKIANETRAHIFVSIHIDANTSSHVNGTTTYYCKADSGELARHIQENLVAANGLRNIGTRNNSFYVIRNTQMPAVLVECAFISNPSDASLLITPSFRQKCANGIFTGLVSYARAKGLGTTVPVDFTTDLEKIEEKKQQLEKEITKSETKGIEGYSER